MTDKQIIKHNVNVSKCEFLGFPRSSKAYCVCDSSELSDICDETPNCYYKNWQRKEQECERLRFPMPDTNYAILTKEEFEQLDRLKSENKHLNDLINQALKELEKTRETLTEIKEIAEKHAPRCNDNANCDYGCEACHLSDLKQILQKISGVEHD